ncbi:MAG: alkaline phosphatase family protein, partial [Actinomycetota bacterium]|nr:alkaline phosphatase family protein [Actinomycetota bacterium]
SFCRDFGKTRLIAIDCRAGRLLAEDNREMVDEDEWNWIVGEARGDFDHLLLGMSDPYLLAPGMHDFQAWNEALCRGAWGDAAARLAERIRERVDLDHWGSFHESFDRLTGLVTDVATGKRGEAPASIVALSGDVHNAYLAQVAFRRGSGARSRVYQAVCSPIRNPLRAKERAAQRFGGSKAGEVIGRVLATAVGLPRPSIRWRYVRGASFDNQVGTLELEGRKAHLRVERAVPGHDGPRLEPVFEYQLA